MSWRDDLAAFGITVPADLDLDTWARKFGDSPARNTAATVAVSSLLFFAAERGHNPKVKDVWDATVYCSTCLSVGYGDIFARTPVGKIIGTTLMTVGPSLSGMVLDGAADRRARDDTQDQILLTLQKILEKLESSAQGFPGE